MANYVINTYYDLKLNENILKEILDYLSSIDENKIKDYQGIGKFFPRKEDYLKDINMYVDPKFSKTAINSLIFLNDKKLVEEMLKDWGRQEKHNEIFKDDKDKKGQMFQYLNSEVIYVDKTKEEAIEQYIKDFEISKEETIKNFIEEIGIINNTIVVFNKEENLNKKTDEKDFIIDSIKTVDNNIVLKDGFIFDFMDSQVLYFNVTKEKAIERYAFEFMFDDLETSEKKLISEIKINNDTIVIIEKNKLIT